MFCSRLNKVPTWYNVNVTLWQCTAVLCNTWRKSVRFNPSLRINTQGLKLILNIPVPVKFDLYELLKVTDLTRHRLFTKYTTHGIHKATALAIHQLCFSHIGVFNCLLEKPKMFHGCKTTFCKSVGVLCREKYQGSI